MLSLKKKTERARGAVVEQARTTVRGQHGFGGGAWGQLAFSRERWLETTWGKCRHVPVWEPPARHRRPGGLRSHERLGGRP